MEIEKRRAFIINFVYFAIFIVLGFILLKFGLPLIAPFVIAFVIAYALKTPIHFISDKLHVHRKIMAVILVLLFYSTIGVLLSLLGIKLFAAVESLSRSLPGIYATHIEPVLPQITSRIEASFLGMDAELVKSLEEMLHQFVQSLGTMISGLSVNVIGFLSGMASTLPGLFIKMVLMIIATFFIAIDYDKIVTFTLNQLSEKKGRILLYIKEYISGTLLVCIRSYGLIMGITFLELSIGLTVLGINHAPLIALSIAVFDILPVLGTGGVMIPWAALTFVQGNYSLAVGLAVLYLIITVIRNIIEPKIIGSQIGLHPIVTLISMFIGVQLFGLIGLFGFPILLSLLKQLNDKEIIHLWKT